MSITNGETRLRLEFLVHNGLLKMILESRMGAELMAVTIQNKNEALYTECVHSGTSGLERGCLECTATNPNKISHLQIGENQATNHNH